jgi:O-antigen/teichoic acid export membrane protein
MPFVVHALGDRTYGIWTIVAGFAGYYAVLELGFSTAINRHLSRALGSSDEDECNRVFNSALGSCVVLGIVTLLLSGIMAALVPTFSMTQEDVSLFRGLVLVLGLTVSIQLPMKLFAVVLEANLGFDRTAVIEILSLILRSAFTVLVLVRGHGVVVMACVNLLSSVPGWLLYIYFFRSDLPFLRLQWNFWQIGTTKALLSYSVYSLIAHLADILRFRLDAVVVGAYVGFAAVTHYKIARVLTQVFILFMTSTMGVLAPVFSGQEGAQNYRALKTTFLLASKISVCTASFVGFGLVAWGKPFIIRWMGIGYSDAYPILVVLVLGCTFMLWQGPSVSLLYGTSRHKLFALFSSIEGVANLLLTLWLVHPLGMLGVALGTCIPMTINKLFIQPVYVCRVAKIPYPEYVGKTARTLAVVGSSLIIPLALSLRFATPDYRVLAAVGVLSLLLYAAPLWLLEFSGEEKVRVLRGILPKLAITDLD